MAAPYHDRDGFIWYDGEMKPWRDSNVHLLTHGLHYGSAVFEGERAYGGHIFKSREHSERLHESGRLMGMKIPFDVDAIEAAKAEVMKANNLSDAYIRAVAWRGSEMMGVAAQSNTIHLAVAAWEWGAYFGDAKMQGVRLAISEWRRPDPRTAPSKAKAAGLYMICTLSKHKAEQDGFNDALMLDWRGRVAEATGANVFFVKDGEIHTPDADAFLNGITRQTVIKLAQARQIPVHVRAIMPEELGSFEGCFLTGTAAEVTPVSQIAEHSYAVGDIVRQMVTDYDDLVRGKLTL